MEAMLEDMEVDLVVMETMLHLETLAAVVEVMAVSNLRSLIFVRTFILFPTGIHCKITIIYNFNPYHYFECCLSV